MTVRQVIPIDALLALLIFFKQYNVLITHNLLITQMIKIHKLASYVHMGDASLLKDGSENIANSSLLI